MMRFILAVLGSTAWIGLSEFFRNEILFKGLWIEKYASLSLTFPSTMLNNAVWGIWSLVMAFVVVFLSRKLAFWETVLVTWLSAFVMMWLVIGNLNVLPLPLLWYALPLSLLEAVVATLIARAILASSVRPQAS